MNYPALVHKPVLHEVTEDSVNWETFSRREEHRMIFGAEVAKDFSTYLTFDLTNGTLEWRSWSDWDQSNNHRDLVPSEIAVLAAHILAGDYEVPDFTVPF